MMKKQQFSHFVGIDVSKKDFDVALMPDPATHELVSLKFSNDHHGISRFLKALDKHSMHVQSTLFCMEHTGIYGRLLSMRLVEQQAHLWMEMSLKIIRSMGVQRGKSDRIDARRIAQYACRYSDQAELFKMPPAVLSDSRTLLTARNKLIEARKNLSSQLSELKHFDSKAAMLAANAVKRSLKAIGKDILDVDQQIQALITQDDELNQTMALATSVPGIGKLTALYLACFTNGFSKYANAKQLACYCGIVPFEYTSGSSVKGKPKVHNMANKLLKKQLHMCALAAIRHDPELRTYFNRKVEEGKHKMLVVNNVRNKLIQRLCAVMQRGTPYVKNSSENLSPISLAGT